MGPSLPVTKLRIPPRCRPSIASSKPSMEIHPLGIGGKEDPVRLVFDSQTGPAINASIIDLGNRFRCRLDFGGGRASHRL